MHAHTHTFSNTHTNAHTHLFWLTSQLCFQFVNVRGPVLIMAILKCILFIYGFHNEWFTWRLSGVNGRCVFADLIQGDRSGKEQRGGEGKKAGQKNWPVLNESSALSRWEAWPLCWAGAQEPFNSHPTQMTFTILKQGTNCRKWRYYCHHYSSNVYLSLLQWWMKMKKRNNCCNYTNTLCVTLKGIQSLNVHQGPELNSSSQWSTSAVSETSGGLRPPSPPRSRLSEHLLYRWTAEKVLLLDGVLKE